MSRTSASLHLSFLQSVKDKSRQTASPETPRNGAVVRFVSQADVTPLPSAMSIAMDETEFPIYSAAIACDDEFETAVEIIVAGALALKDLQQRFWAWANNSGVFAEPFMRLDVRLRGHQEPQRMIRVLIDLIVKNLKTAVRLHLKSGDGLGGATSSMAVATPDGAGVSASDLPSKLQHLEGTFHGISGALERLERLASMVERSSQRSLPGRIQAFAENGKASFLRYEMLANAIMSFKYPHANALLKHQLGRSLVYRRQRISYRLNRQTRYEGKLNRLEEKRAHASRSSSNPAELNAVPPPSNPPSTHPPTFISEDFERLQRHERQKEIGNPQRPVSVVSSWAGEVQVEYPKPPSLEEGLDETNAEKKLQCNFCGKMYFYKDLSDKKWWRKHVDEDLDVFVCIAEECANPPVGFSRYSLWREHMETEHGIDWMDRIHQSSEGRPGKPLGHSASGNADATCLLCKMPVDVSVPNHDAVEVNLDTVTPAQHHMEHTETAKKIRRVRFSEISFPITTETQKELSGDRVVDRQQGSIARRAKMSKHIAGHLKVLCFQILAIDLGEEGDMQDNPDGDSVNPKSSKEGSVARSSRDDLDSVTFSFDKSPSPHERDHVPPSDLHTIELYTKHSVSKAEAGGFFFNPLESDDGSSDEPEDIWEMIDGRLISLPSDDFKMFLPLNDLRNLVSKTRVRRALENLTSSVIAEDAIDEYTNHVCEVRQTADARTTTRQKIFATLIRIEYLQALPDIVDEGIHDLHLPLELQRGESGSRWYLFYRLADGGRVEFKGSYRWSKARMGAFYEKQWLFLSPFFDMKATEAKFYPLESQIVLPFVKSQRSSEDAYFGGFGDVFRMDIHPAHHNYDAIANPTFAIKKLHNKDKKKFDAEFTAYKKFNHQDHPHVLKLLATYHHHGQYHFVFPWADGNLRELWQRYEKPQRVHRLVVWLARQAWGIASGLQLIQHPPEEEGSSLAPTRDFGRHGDIKPENVLWFCDEPQEREFSGEGILKITDFGLTRYHRGVSSPKIELLGEEGFSCSLTYKAPEVDISNVSQAYDIWTLGTLLLEFVVWYFDGWEGVDKFSLDRANESHDPDHDIPLDTFFNWGSDQGGRKAVLKRSVTTLIERLHSHPDCSLFFHSLLTYIVHRMICISPDERDKCDVVVSRLQKMASLCRDDSVYACQGCPKPGDTIDATDIDNSLLTSDNESKLDADLLRQVNPAEDPLRDPLRLISDMSAAAVNTSQKPQDLTSDGAQASSTATYSTNPYDRQKNRFEEDEDDDMEERRKRLRLSGRGEDQIR